MRTAFCPPTRRYRWGDEAYKVYKIVDYDPTRSDGKYYLVAWADADEHGKAYPDSWEPTKFVGKALRDAFFSEKQEKVRRLITVDARPLDSLVQRSIATAVMADRSENFGIEHQYRIDALSLLDVAKHFFQVLETTYGFTVKDQYFPKSKVMITEARAATPELVRCAQSSNSPVPAYLLLTLPRRTVRSCPQVGEFLRFETVRSALTGVKSLRYALGRAQNKDLQMVGVPLIFRISYSSQTPGTCVFEADFPTIKINGATGALRPPHAVTGLLKSQAVRDACMMYARAHMPAKHPLRLARWCALPAHVRELATPVGFEA